MTPDLPIDAVLPQVVATLADGGAAVLQAPPGAGKTTGVPVALRQSGVINGKILMLEPRRVAARAAATRLADLLGEQVGMSVGYRMRGAHAAGTDIEVVTDGILVRMLQSDPELTDVGCVIFDEFHERALQADLGLALSLEVREALRPDLALLAMSATLDAEPVAALMGDVPVITAKGRAFDVETRWLDRPLGTAVGHGPAFIAAAVELVIRAAREAPGDILVFLPGVAEIAQVTHRLDPAHLGGPDGSVARVLPLHGRLSVSEQRAALCRAEPGVRHVVLATSIAETSLTLPGVRVVVDSGRARRARHDPSSGMSRLVTERVSRAEAAQRRGRAGRVAPGVCYRLWTKGEEGGFAPFAPPEIAVADLAPLALELAVWGAADAGSLRFLTAPNPGSYAAAQQLLTGLGALDQNARVTPMGRRMAGLPVHPRLARMMLTDAPQAPLLAALIETGTPRRGRGEADLTPVWRTLRGEEQGLSIDPQAARGIQDLARRLRTRRGDGPDMSLGALAALAFPDRIALRRPGKEGRYLLSGGSGAVIDASDVLASARLLVAVDLDGDRRDARIRAALPLQEAEVRSVFDGQITKHHVCQWSARNRQIDARIEERFGAIPLHTSKWEDPPDALCIPALLDGISQLGLGALNWTAKSRSLRDRAEWLRRHAQLDLPDMSDVGLIETLDQWLAPYLVGVRRFEHLKEVDLVPVFDTYLGRKRQQIDILAPERFEAPTGTTVWIDYSADEPEISLRLQEMFGLDRHPALGTSGRPILVTLLSPAGRPVQKTRDLPGFWRSSYDDVRKDMRGRYPRHPWPEDPLSAVPTRRAKPRR